jgi:(p)ppGpp synthase/HD superfamily hydrolase
LDARFDEALTFASRLHRAQRRKGTSIPYISHLLAVCALVIEDGGSDDEAIAALLHDALEDQASRYPGGRSALRLFIEHSFGSRVLKIVDDCTDDERLGKLNWRGRKNAYLEHIRQADAASRRVSCADKLHNARCILADCRKIGEHVWERFRTKSRDDQLWYYAELVRAFNETSTAALAEELGRVVAELRRECGVAATEEPQTVGREVG